MRHVLEPTQRASEEEDECPPVLRRESGRLGLRRNSLQLEELYSSVGAYENKISDDARDVLLKVRTRASAQIGASPVSFRVEIVC